MPVGWLLISSPASQAGPDQALTLTVTDDDDLTASDEVIVTVESAPKPRRPAA